MNLVDGNTSTSVGWRHYWKETFVRGCVGESVNQCVRMWVNTALTTNTSITCEWTLADGEGSTLLAHQDTYHFHSHIGIFIPQIQQNYLRKEIECSHFLHYNRFFPFEPITKIMKQ